MSINLTIPKDNSPNLKPKLKVIGIGGAGGNAVNNMIRSELEGVDFVVANTDAQSLSQSGTERRIQLGARLTEGLGAGSKPDIGRGAAEESLDEIVAELEGAHMAFIAAGMGGGTGTGGAPVIARAAKERGILTVGVVTKPFQFEGSHRMKQANEGVEILEQFVDTLIVIPNQNLFRIANEKTTFTDAFSMADEVLYSGVRGVTDLMVMPGLINLDFADIRSVMSQMGKAMMGTGEANGERRALDAAEAAIANPLLDDTSMKGAKGVLINITGGKDITLFEVDEAANRIRAEVDEEANIMVGSAFDESIEGIMRVSVVATGININTPQMVLPTMLDLAENLDSSIEVRSQPEERFLDAEVLKNESESSEEDSRELVADAHLDSGLQLQSEEGKNFFENTIPSIDTTDAFIPPKPTLVAAEEMEGEKITLRAIPENEAEMLNNGSEAPEDVPQIPWHMKGVSLFERVTGTGKSSFVKKESSLNKDEKINITPFSGSPIVEGSIDQVKDSEEIENQENNSLELPKVATESKASDVELTANEFDDKENDLNSENTEDLLDIPAFLRRQAN